jgi:hypothetical protein
MIPFDPADVWSWTGGALAPSDPTQESLRGGVVTPGAPRRADAFGEASSRSAIITPGSSRRVN